MASLRTRLLAIITLLAFVAAVVGPLFPERAAAAEPCAMMMDMAGHTDGSSKHMPMPGCGGDLSCIVMCALPATATTPLATEFAWADVGYWASVRALAGVSISPDPSPPRSRV